MNIYHILGAGHLGIFSSAPLLGFIFHLPFKIEELILHH